MSARLTAVASLDDRRPAGPLYRLIIAVDIEGSTTRTDPVKGELRRVIYDLLEQALEAVGIAGNLLEPLADRGDGILALARSHDDVPKTALLDRLIPLLAAMLAEYNAQAASPALRVRLRVVVHAGDIHLDRRGCYGEAIDVAIRLLDAPPVKKALREAAAPLVLVVSDEIYFTVVRHGYVDADTYCPLAHVRVAGRPHRGWVHVPSPAPVPAAVSQAPAVLSPLGRRPGALGQAALAITEQRALLLGRLPGRPGGLLGRQRPGTGDTGLHPGGEPVVGGDAVRGDPQPAGHLPALHHGDDRRGGGDQFGGPLGVDVHEHAALPARADRHVPTDQEGKAAEHLLLGQLGVGADQIPDALGKDFVVGHGPIVPSRTDSPAPL